MPGILNTVIALVVVLLVLSLLVQSLQTLVKKLLKLKSGELEQLLEDLYEQAIERSDTPVVPFGSVGLRGCETNLAGPRLRGQGPKNSVQIS